MTPTTTEPAGTTWPAIGTTIRLLATDPASLEPARALVSEHLAALDHAVSRFRPDSEVSLLAERARTADSWVIASRLFADHLRAAIRVARLTDGLVDPTVGSAVVASGYDDDMGRVRARTVPYAAPLTPAAVPGWRAIRFDPATDRVGVPQGCLLDLGSTAKAHAADTIATLLAERLDGGFLVNLGGDIAVSGDLPEGGWRIGIEDAAGRVLQVVTSTGQAITTSSTRLRAWRNADGSTGHHIVDPRTGRTAPATWAQASCAGTTALEANAASTAAIVLGPGAPAWLEAHGIPGRLDAADGAVFRTAGWPDDDPERTRP